MNTKKQEFWSFIVIDSYIAFILFSIFATIMLIYVIFNLDVSNNIKNFVKAIENYLNPDEISVLVNNSIFISEMEKIKQNSIQTEIENKSYNQNFYNNQVIISTVYLLGISIIFIIVLYLLKFDISKISWKHIGIIIIINICLILLYELLFIYLSISKYNIVKLNNILKLSLGLAVN